VLVRFPRTLSKRAVNVVTLAVIAAVLCGGFAFYLRGRHTTRSVTAQFSSAVGIYPGTPVKILGIAVGKVTAVHPHGATVSVRMSYDREDALPRNAIAVIVANSLVSDRFVQLAPAYSGAGPILLNNATIPESRTASPAELDDIYAALNKLSVALGPKGANKTGSLRELVDVAAANLRGNGAALGTSISKLSAAAQTLANGRVDLFGTIKNLQAFTKALADSDGAVRHVNQQLADVAADLAGERQDLGAALHNLATALDQVAGFVRTNAAKAHTDIAGLRNLTQILIKEQASLNETLAVAPAALSNIVHAYQPDLGVIATRTNLDSLADPATLCALLDPALIPGVPDTIKSAAGGLTAPLKKTCAQVLAKIPLGELLGQLGLPTNLTGAALGEAINGLLTRAGTGLGGIITGGH
jgi:phospholipid/cholesterol/gamma-HCH transport system substrate-binding protein